MSSSTQSLPKLIGFCGYALSGKNTAAEQLNEILKVKHPDIEYKLIGFADSLKGDIKPCIDFCKDYGIDTTTKEFKTKFRPMWVLWSRIAKEVTDNKFIWVKRLFDLLDAAPQSHIAICDVRYDYEVKEIIERGGVVFFINREGVTFANEEEQTSFEEIKQKYFGVMLNYLIHNNDTKIVLGLKVYNRLVKHAENNC